MEIYQLIILLEKEIELKTIQRDKWIAATNQDYAEAARLREIEIKLMGKLQKLESKYDLKN